MISLIQHFEADFLCKVSLTTESQPQNPEFRNNSENFHPCRFYILKKKFVQNGKQPLWQHLFYNISNS